MTPADVFALLSRADDPHPACVNDTHATMTRTDIDDNEKAQDVWIRLLSRLAAGDVARKMACPVEGKCAFLDDGDPITWRALVWAEDAMEAWEEYFAGAIASKRDPEGYAEAKRQGLCPLLF